MCRWWSYIHANRQHPTFLAPDPLTDSCPTDPATHFGVCVEAATTAPHNALSSPLALVSTPWPAVARRQTTTSRRQTTLLALQLSAVPPPVAHGRSHHLLCLTISAQLFRSNIFDVEIYLIVLLSVLIFSKTTGARVPGLSSPNNVCKTARLALVLMSCARAYVNQGVAISTGYELL